MSAEWSWPARYERPERGAARSGMRLLSARLAVLGIVIGLLGLPAATGAANAPANEGPAAGTPSGPTRDLFIDPPSASVPAGQAASFSAWFCERPGSGSPFGPDEHPSTADDTCRPVLRAVWSVNDEAAATLLGQMGATVKVTGQTTGAEVTVTAKRAAREGSARLSVVEAPSGPTRDLFIDPPSASVPAGQAASFSAWFCERPGSGSPFGPDEHPSTADDTCRPVLRAVWSVNDEAAATLLGQMGATVKVTGQTTGAEVTVTAKRAAREGSARLSVVEPGVLQPDGTSPNVVEPAGSTAVGPLLGTVGFRSASPTIRGWYVTTALSMTGNCNGQLAARSSPNLLTLEMGLFRDSDGRFKLLGENGLWVARKDGSLRAVAKRWADAWSFRAIRPRGTSAAVCLVAYAGGKVAGLATLKTSGVLGIRSASSLRSATAGCIATNDRALFYTDRLPKRSTPLSALLNKSSPLDGVTRVRFVPPDRKVSLTAAQRRDAILSIDIWFNSYDDYLSYVRANTWDHLDAVADPLTVADGWEPGEDPEKVEWWNVVFQAAGAATGLIDLFTKANPYVKAAAAAISAVTAVVSLGIAANAEANNANLNGPRRIPGVTTATVGSVDKLRSQITADHIRARDNTQLMHKLLKQGCGVPTKACDRRLSEWLRSGPSWPAMWGQLADREIFAKKVEFMKELLPIRGRLYATDGPNGWLHIESETGRSRGWNIHEYLGAADFGFGTHQGSEAFRRYVLFTSVWRPWYHKSWRDYPPPVEWRYRPKQFAWAIGLKGDDEQQVTELMEGTFDLLFQPVNEQSPLEGGMGLSYKEVACEWLTNKPHAGGYNAPSGSASGAAFDPCHFSFYDPSQSSPTSVNAKERWVRPDATAVATYSSASTYAVPLWVPDLAETRAGRDSDDPDLFSWMIPHLAFGPARADADKYPKSEPKGSRKTIPVYFANLTQGAVTIHLVKPEGVTPRIGPALRTIPRWNEIKDILGIQGAIPYSSQTAALARVASWVGATYLVRTVPQDGGSAVDIGTYTVESPPSGASVCRGEPETVGPCQVAEIHGHFEGANNDGVLDDTTIGTSGKLR